MKSRRIDFGDVGRDNLGFGALERDIHVVRYRDVDVVRYWYSRR